MRAFKKLPVREPAQMAMNDAGQPRHNTLASKLPLEETGQVASRLKTQLRRSYHDIHSGKPMNAETPASMLWDQAATISTLYDLIRAAGKFNSLRDSLARDYLVSEPFSGFIMHIDTLHDLFLREKDYSSRLMYVEALGALGSVLCADEKNYIGTRLAEVLKKEPDPFMRISAIVSLVGLGHAPSAGLIAAEGANRLHEIQMLSYKSAAILVFNERPGELVKALAGFLNDDYGYGPAVKKDAMLLLYTLNNKDADIAISTYLNDVIKTKGEIDKWASGEFGCAHAAGMASALYGAQSGFESDSIAVQSFLSRMLTPANKCAEC